MNGWAVLALCWAAYMFGFFTAALMAAARDD
jgi:hypothetical protein